MLPKTVTDKRDLFLYAATDSLPSAPDEGEYIPQDASGLKTFDGYGNVGFTAGGYLPPPPPPPVEPGPVPEMTFGT